NVLGSNIVGNLNQSSSLVVLQGDFGSLQKALAELGVPAEETKALSTAIEEDKKAGNKKGFGEKTAAWLSSVGKYLSKEGVKVAGEAARAALTKAVLIYFGLEK